MTAAAPTVLVARQPLSARARQLQAATGAVPGPQSAAAAAPVVVWAEPWARTVPLPGGFAVHVMDLHGALAACPGWGAAAQAAWCAQVAGLCRGAGLGLVGSAAEHGFWTAVLGAADVDLPLATLPHAAIARPMSATPTLAIDAASFADPALRPALDASLAWARAAGFAVVTTASAGKRLAVPGLALAGEEAATLLLDLRQDTPAARTHAPPAVLDALAAGTAVVTTVDGPLGRSIAAAGAGAVMTGAFQPPADLPAAARAARALWAAWPADADVLPAIRAATARAEARRAAWRRGGRPPQPLGPQGHVLVLSEESPNLASIRVQLPLAALHRRGAIAGYAVLRRGELVHDTRPAGSRAAFDAIWVHRSMDPMHLLLLQVLARPYVYDVDDNLLAAPSYRDRFGTVSRDTVAALLRGAAVVTCATGLLAGLLARRMDRRLADRLVVAPNLAQDRPLQRDAGPPQALVWASSDRPALTVSRSAIVRAIRDHCLAHGSRLVCIGAAPPPELLGSGVAVEAIGLLPHATYREHLAALSPGILVCPLETDADAETQDFVDGKSDVKVIEALSSGLVAVCSRAAPYADSGLDGRILCDNTYDAWIDGLAQARDACLAPAPVPPWPPARDSADEGLAPWADALSRVRLPAPLPWSDVAAAMASVQAQEAQGIGRDEFDEDHYLANYEDVRQAVQEGGLGSGFDHYDGAGRGERRHARKRPTAAVQAEAWWAQLLHDVSRLEDGVAQRTARIEALEQRLALRRTLASGAL